MSERPAQILVVDDDPEIRGVIRKFLAPEGYDLHAATSAREAFRALEGHVIDLVLTDLVMPDDEGIAMGQCHIVEAAQLEPAAADRTAGARHVLDDCTQ